MWVNISYMNDMGAKIDAEGMGGSNPGRYYFQTAWVESFRGEAVLIQVAFDYSAQLFWWV